MRNLSSSEQRLSNLRRLVANHLYMPAFAALAAAVGCADAPPARWANAEPPPCPLARRWYQVDRVTAPVTQSQVTALGLDLDGMEPVRPDNALGNIRAAFAGQDIDFDGPLTETLASGNLGWYIAIDTCADGSADYAAVYASDGGGRDRDVPAVGVVDAAGTVTASGGVAAVPAIALFLVAPAESPIEWSPGAGLAVDLALQPDGSLEGRYGIGVGLRGDAYVRFTDALAREANLLVAGDPGCPAACLNDGAAYVSDSLDVNHDGLLTGDEFRSNSFIKELFSPDVDLIAVAATGADVYGRTDGRKDHLSLGVGIHAVPLE